MLDAANQAMDALLSREPGYRGLRLVNPAVKVAMRGNLSLSLIMRPVVQGYCGNTQRQAYRSKPLGAGDATRWLLPAGWLPALPRLLSRLCGEHTEAGLHSTCFRARGVHNAGESGRRAG